MANERIIAWKHLRPGCYALTLRPLLLRGNDEPPTVCDACKQHGEFELRPLSNRPRRRL